MMLLGIPSAAFCFLARRSWRRLFFLPFDLTLARALPAGLVSSRADCSSQAGMGAGALELGADGHASAAGGAVAWAAVGAFFSGIGSEPSRSSSSAHGGAERKSR